MFNLGGLFNPEMVKIANKQSSEYVRNALQALNKANGCKITSQFAILDSEMH